MKALTLYQPWATLVAIGAKKIETRSWITNYRGKLAVHAGRERRFLIPDFHIYEDPFYGITTLVPEEIRKHPENLVLGCIVAICDLVRVDFINEGYYKYIPWEERAFGDYTPGRYAWILENVEALENPVPVKGRQGLWEWKR